MDIPLLSTHSIEDKRVIVRTDYNISLDNNHHIANDTRIKQSIPTLQLLLQHNNRIRIISHLGRPEKYDSNLSLKLVQNDLQKLLKGYEVVLITDFHNEVQFNQQTSRQIILLENIRFFKQETENNQLFAKELATLGDVYINDAFADSHRNHASIVGIPAFLPSYAGLAFEKEIASLKPIMESPKKPFVAIIGGGKIDKINLVSKLTKMCDTLLIGGKFIDYFQKDGKAVLESLRQNTDIIMPIDAIYDNGIIADIGPKTVILFETYINNANTILWNGPMGKTEFPEFLSGTLGVLDAITKNHNAYSLVGGGDTITAIQHDKHKNAISHISTSGGALIEYIEKGTLAGIKALASS